MRFTLTESGVADRWSIGCLGGDPALYVNPGSGVTAGAPVKITTTAAVLAAGMGLQFQGGGDALDQYDEGTFTLSFLGSGTAPSVTVSARDESYLRIGNRVWCQGYVQLSAASGGTGSLIFGGLPFAAAAGSSRGAFAILAQNLSSHDHLFGRVRAGSSLIDLYLGGNASGGLTAIDTSQLTATSGFWLSFSYEV